METRNLDENHACPLRVLGGFAAPSAGYCPPSGGWAAKSPIYGAASPPKWTVLTRSMVGGPTLIDQSVDGYAGHRVHGMRFSRLDVSDGVFMTEHKF